MASNKKTAAVTEVPMTRLMDLSVFAVAYSAYVAKMGSDDPLSVKGGRLAKRFGPALAVGIEQHLATVAKRKDAAPLRPSYRVMQRSKPPAEGVADKGSFLRDALGWLVSRQGVFRSTFKGRPAQVARQIGNAAGDDTAAELVSKLAGIAPISGLTIPHKWVKEAAEALGVGLHPVEDLVTGASGASAVADKIAEIDGRLRNLGPRGDEAAGLQAERAALMDQVLRIASGQPDQREAILAAASTRIYTQDEYATPMGRQLGLTAEQEDAMMVQGKALIAAGAGSGKTRVLAGKVVDTIRRLGAKSGQIIATSFSKKSAHELKHRVKKYGGADILDSGDDGFGTTHSVGLKLLREFSPVVSKNTRIIEPGKIIRIAMAQTKMRGETWEIPQPPPAKGIFEGIYNTLGGLPTQQTDDVNISADPAKQQFIDICEELMGLAQWGISKDYSWARRDAQLLDAVLGSGKGPAELTERERTALNQLFSSNRAINKFKRNNWPHTYRVAATPQLDLHTPPPRVAASKTAAPSGAKTRFWKEPANQWFNQAYKDLTDEDGRAIGARRFETAMSNYRAEGISPEQAWQKDRSKFAAVYGAYEWLRKKDPSNANSIDFDDMLQEAVKLLIANPAALKAVQSRFRHLLVDEAQDLNKQQHLMFGLIAGTIDPKAVSDASEIHSINDVMFSDGRMVAESFVFIGDDKQAIYEFRGADPDEFIEKSDLVTSDGQAGGSFATKVISSNFRSGKNIVDAANKLIARNTKQVPMTCSTNPERGEGQINFASVASHGAGAEMAAMEIEQLIASDGWSVDPPSFGIGVRTNAEALAYGVELIKKGIPFRSKMNFFTDPTTKALVAWLNLASADAGDKKAINKAVLECHNAPKFWLDRRFNDNLQRQARGKNYLDFLQGGGWRSIYEGRMEWKNAKNVKPYVDTLTRVASFTGSPNDILQQILALEGISIKRGEAPKSIVDTLVDRVKGSPEAMDMLFEEAGEGAVDDDAIRGMALAPVAPLMSLMGSYEDLAPALEYVGKLERAAAKKAKKDTPGSADFEEPAVIIDTCHGWKGLEAINMWVPMAAGVFPHKRSEGSVEDLASERRLAYVALTRGRDSVTVICPDETHMGQPGGISRFVDEACIPPVGGKEDDPVAAAPARTASSLSDSWLDNYIRHAAQDELEDSWGSDLERS